MTKRHRPLGNRKYIGDPIPAAFAGHIVVVIGGGPSLTKGQVNSVRREWAVGRVKVLGINRAFEICPWADALYAADLAFWMEYIAAIRDANIELLFCTDEEPARRFGLWHIPPPKLEEGSHAHALVGLSPDPAAIHWGLHSGYQALNLAVHLLGDGGRIVLLGYDCRHVDGKAHWHSDYESLANAINPQTWAPLFDNTLDVLRDKSIEVINATPGSAIQCYERMHIEAALM